LEGSINFRPDFKQFQTGYLYQQAAAKQDFPVGVFEIVLLGNLAKKKLWPFYNHAEKSRAEEKMRLLDIPQQRKTAVFGNFQADYNGAFCLPVHLFHTFFKKVISLFPIDFIDRHYLTG
jgi:hypothetical protein